MDMDAVEVFKSVWIQLTDEYIEVNNIKDDEVYKLNDFLKYCRERLNNEFEFYFEYALGVFEDTYMAEKYEKMVMQMKKIIIREFIAYIRIQY